MHLINIDGIICCLYSKGPKTVNGSTSWLELEAGAVGGSVVVHATPGSTIHVTEMTVRPLGGLNERSLGGRLPPMRWIELSAADGISGAGCVLHTIDSSQNGAPYSDGIAANVYDCSILTIDE